MIQHFSYDTERVLESFDFRLVFDLPIGECLATVGRVAFHVRVSQLCEQTDSVRTVDFARLRQWWLPPYLQLSSMQLDDDGAATLSVEHGLSCDLIIVGCDSRLWRSLKVGPLARALLMHAIIVAWGKLAEPV